MAIFEVWPAIDLLDGKCARLAQGDYRRKTIYPQDPVALARQFAEAGLDRLHVVDLDGAREGRPVNTRIVADIAAVGVSLEIGGGVRTAEHIRLLLDSGASQVILGSTLVKQRERIPEWMLQFPGRLVAGVDIDNGRIAVEGWREHSPVDPMQLLADLEALGFERVIITDVSQDGMLQGPNLELLGTVASSTTMKITAAGGVSSLADLQALARMAGRGISGAIVGRAFYEGRITMEEMASC